MIDEKKLVKEICNTACIVPKFETNELLNAYLLGLNAKQICVMDLIANQPKVNEWIPVKDRLPDKPGSYRVTCLYADKWYRVKDDLFYSDKTWGYDNIHRERKVIAWKEIEEPYKGEIE